MLFLLFCLFVCFPPTVGAVMTPFYVQTTLKVSSTYFLFVDRLTGFDAQICSLCHCSLQVLANKSTSERSQGGLQCNTLFVFVNFNFRFCYFCFQIHILCCQKQYLQDMSQVLMYLILPKYKYLVVGLNSFSTLVSKVLKIILYINRLVGMGQSIQCNEYQISSNMFSCRFTLKRCLSD